MKGFKLPPQKELDEFSSLKDFYNYYKSVPSKFWCITVFKHNNTYCARGLLRATNFWNSTKADLLILNLAPKLAQVNNGNIWDYQQKTPKARVLAYLKDLMKHETQKPRRTQVPS